MSLDDALLACLALERQAYAIYGDWGRSVDPCSPLNELLSRLADQSDRHKASLWDLAMRHDLAPPPRVELDLGPGEAGIEAAKFTLRQAIVLLTSLAADLEGHYRSIVERIRNEDEAQLRQLLILSPEPRLGVSVGERRESLQGLATGEPRWRPGIV